MFKTVFVIGSLGFLGATSFMVKYHSLTGTHATEDYTNCADVTDKDTGTCTSNPKCAEGKTCHTSNQKCECTE